jgi:hypothetical protein
MKLYTALYYLIFLTMVLSCNHTIKKNEEISVKNETALSKVSGSTYFFTQLKLTKDDSIINKGSSKNVSIHLARKYYNEITENKFTENIGSVNKSKAIINNYGNVEIFEINVSGKGISNVTPKRCYLLYNKEKSEAFVFNFNQLFLLKQKISDTGIIIGGIIITKGIGYFLCYSFQNSSFTKVFDSGFDVDDSITTVPVYLNNGDCIKYSNDYLKFENKDINNDGLLDFAFYGTVLFYCNPNEYGIDISNRKPFRHENIVVNYILEKSENKLKWVLADNILIKKVFSIK